MMIPAAINLGIDLRVFAQATGEPASLAVRQLGDFRNVGEVREFANEVDVVTFDHEHVPSGVLQALQAAGVAVHPGPHALLFAQDKILMRSRLAALGIPQPAWAPVSSAEDLQGFLDLHDGVAVLKTPRGGYDGKGVRVVRSAADAADWLSTLQESGDGSLLVEELVDFARELAQQVARRPSGGAAFWPLVQTVQRDGVCVEVIAPAAGVSDSVAEDARTMAGTIAESLDVTGVLAVELFETTDGRLLVNELAMRPHNSGHWSIDGSITSQFEQHLRAVLDLPLGDTGTRQRWSVMVNILGGPSRDGGSRSVALTERYAAAFAAFPAVKFHNYGKEPRPGRKIGHLSVGGDDLGEVTAQARAAAAFFTD